MRPVVGIIAAAGAGERLGHRGPKAFIPCAGRPLVEWSLGPLEAACDHLVVTVPPEGSAADLPAAVAAVEHVPGGTSRSASVLNAVRAAPSAGAYVIQDAARPLVTLELVERCLAELDRGFEGAVAAAPMADTVKEADPAGTVVRTLDRGRLWSVQTPQAFRGEALRDALAAAGDRLAAATDDAALVEAVGGRVCVVPAPPENIKVTRGTDLAVAEALLRERERSAEEPA